MAVSFALGTARSKLAHGCADEADALAQSSQDAVTAITELREFTQGLNPSILGEVGVMGALESLAERSFLPVTVRGETRGDLPASVEAGARCGGGLEGSPTASPRSTGGSWSRALRDAEQW